MERLIIITGATGGLGSAILSQLNTDADICCLSRKLVENISKSIQADFADDVCSYVDELIKWIDSYDAISEIVLVMTASTITPIDAIGQLQDSIENNITINVISQVKLVDAVVEIAEKKSTDLRIIQFDSGAAYRPISGWAFYCSAKAYISMFLKVLVTEHTEYKIILFDPGIVDTGMQKDIRESSSEVFYDREMFQLYKENGQLNDPGKVAQFVVDRYINEWRAKKLMERFNDFR